MTTLTETTNAVLSGFAKYSLHALQLRNDLLARTEGGTDNETAGLARSTTENLTAYTNLSDGSAYSVDPSDLRRLNGDFEAYKRHLTQIKYMWLESNVKRCYLERLLGLTGDGQGVITQKDCEQLEEEREANKVSLKRKKMEARDVQGRVAKKAQLLDTTLNTQLLPRLEEARTLNRSIQDMELQIAMLRNSRPAEQRMTIAECNDKLDEQIVELQTLGETLETAKAKRVTENTACTALQKQVVELAAERARMDKLETEAKMAGRNKDTRVEENCRHLSDRVTLLKSILCVRTVEPRANGELRILYDLSSGRTATLAVFNDTAQRQLLGAKLIDSNIGIEDIAERCTPSNDVQRLVQEVLARLT